MERYNEMINKMEVQDVYFINDFEGVAYRSTPKGDFYGKTINGKEFKADYSSPIFNDALVEGKEISKEDYNKF